jgi:hypothetical protein
VSHPVYLCERDKTLGPSTEMMVLPAESSGSDYRGMDFFAGSHMYGVLED